MAPERLQRYLARAGVASRRAAEELIRAGLVSVNGRPVTVLGTKIDPERDEVAVRGRKVAPPAGFVYLMINKPSGCLTTMRDPGGRPTVASLLPPGLPRVFPVGRLDLETTGLLLFTNDGELAHALLHPSRGVRKIYLARVSGVPSSAILERLRRGVRLEDGPTAPAAVEILSREDGDATLAIEIHEGRKRQVRRMLAAVGHPVQSLTRIGFGPIALGDLPSGAWRPLCPEEIRALYRAVGRTAAGGAEPCGRECLHGDNQQILPEGSGHRSRNRELPGLRAGEGHRPARALGGGRAQAHPGDPGHRRRGATDDREDPGGHHGRQAVTKRRHR